MSVEETEVIDAIGTDEATGHVCLSIFDHLPWDSIHVVTLEAKLTFYVRFVETGQLRESYPIPAGYMQRIEIFFLHRPDQAALAFLEAAATRIAQRGIGFQFGPLPTKGYANAVG